MKLIISLGIILFFVILSVPVLAENNATSSGKTQKKTAEKETIELKIEKLEPNKKVAVVKARNSVAVRYGIYEKLIERSGNLLTKLQEKIDHAQKAGLKTKVVDGYMADAKARLEDAKLTLESIKSLQGTAIDKKAFQDIQKKFIIIHKDLNTVRQDGAKVIAELKKFNASQPKPTKVATSSASVKP